jgi:hypothetical protein
LNQPLIETLKFAQILCAEGLGQNQENQNDILLSTRQADFY